MKIILVEKQKYIEKSEKVEKVDKIEVIKNFINTICSPSLILLTDF